MPDDLKGQISRIWQGLRKKTAETVARQEAAFARGKIAGTAVTDDAGNILVDAGHRIDDAVIERAEAAGKLHALAAAAVTAKAQDLREKANEYLDSTPEGREKRALSSVEAYAEARRYIGCIAGVDVTDIRGNVIVPAGKEIDNEDIHKAGEAGLLSALIYSAQQPAPAAAVTPPPDRPTGGRTWFGDGPPPDAKPVSAKELAAPAESPAPHRRALPLLTPPEEENEGMKG